MKPVSHRPNELQRSRETRSTVKPRQSARKSSVRAGCSVEIRHLNRHILPESLSAAAKKGAIMAVEGASVGVTLRTLVTRGSAIEAHGDVLGWLVTGLGAVGGGNGEACLGRAPE